MRYALENDNTQNLASNQSATSMRPVLGVATGEQGLPGPGSAAWTAAQAVSIGSVRQAPDGSWIKSTAARTTRASFDATEQTFWTAVMATAGTIEQAVLAGKVPTTRTVTAGTGLTGGGDLSTNRTLAADPEYIRDTIGATLVAGTNVTLTVDDPGDTITIAAAGGGAAGPNVQIFDTSGTWTKPGGTPTRHQIIAVGSGGGGGNGTNSGAGNGGSMIVVDLPTAQVPSTLTVTVGAGGTKAAPATATPTAGNPTTVTGSGFATINAKGGSTTVGGDAVYGVSTGAGSTAVATPAVPILAPCVQLVGGSKGKATAAGDGVGGTGPGPGGGGKGTGQAGGDGGYGAAPGGTGGTTGTAGQAGDLRSRVPGGGGGGSSSGAAGAGGKYGGGGGASSAGTLGGDGGQGGVCVITYFD